MRKPLTGLLTMRIQAVKDVDHAASSRFSRGPETFVVLKVEDAIKARTRATRSDRWQDEAFSIDIEKANEIELTVYDKSGDRPTPIGMLWVRISDIAEEMRRKKIETEFNASGWVSADKMEHGGSTARPDPSAPLGSPQNPGPAGPTGAAGQGQGGAGGPSASHVMVDSWFALEPVGRIHLSMSFGKCWNLRPTSLCDSWLLMSIYSKAIEGSTTIRYRTEPSRCRPPEEGRSPREAGTQVHHAAILQHHALCSLRRFLEVCCRHAVCRLQIYLSSQMLSQGRHQVYQQGQLRDRSRRGEDQPPYPSSFRRICQHLGQLVLPLRLFASLWTQECQAMLRYLKPWRNCVRHERLLTPFAFFFFLFSRMRSCLPRSLHAFGT